MEIPDDLVSFANFRRLADHEELFGSLTRDLLCHVEILNIPEETPLITHALEHHWKQLAKDNECPDESFYEVYENDVCPSAIKDVPAVAGYTVGIQLPKDQNVTLRIATSVVRLESVKADILVTFTSSELSLAVVSEAIRKIGPSLQVHDMKLFA